MLIGSRDRIISVHSFVAAYGMGKRMGYPCHQWIYCIVCFRAPVLSVREAKEETQAVNKAADPGLPEVADARERVAALKQ